MQNRFNRPFGPEQVEALIHKLRETAMARQESDALAADVMFKSLHMMTSLWHECSLHDNLATQAERVLEATEAKLRDSLEKQSIAEAALALAEVERLKSMIRMPLQREAWGQEQQPPDIAKPQ